MKSAKPTAHRRPRRRPRPSRAAGLIATLLIGVAFPAGLARALTVTTASVTMAPITLDGMDQTVAGTTSAWRVDAAGETGGWNMTVASTDFTNGSSEQIPVSGFSIRLLDSNIALVSGDPSGPTSTQTVFGSLSGTPLKIASAAPGDGNGVYDATPDFELSVPADTYSGSYVATVTVDVAAGP